MGLSDRGVGVQATGFAVIGCVSIAILQIFSHSDYLLYQWFEMAATRLYWAFVVPLAALFDWGRIMFAKGKAIREAKKAEVIAKITEQIREQVTAQIREQVTAQITEQVTEQGIERERHRVEAVLARHGVALSREVANELFGDSHSDRDA